MINNILNRLVSEIHLYTIYIVHKTSNSISIQESMKKRIFGGGFFPSSNLDRKTNVNALIRKEFFLLHK
jgi:hypothetical protein